MGETIWYPINFVSIDWILVEYAHIYDHRIGLNDFLFIKNEKINNLNKSIYYWDHVKLFLVFPSIGTGFAVKILFKDTFFKKNNKFITILNSPWL